MNIRNFLYDKFYIKKDAIITKQKPTHGNCCTCQKCGFPHDECKCEENAIIELRDEYEKLQAERDSLKSKLDKPTEKMKDKKYNKIQKRNKQMDYTLEEITTFINDAKKDLKLISNYNKAINICEQLKAELENITYERDRWVEDYKDIQDKLNKNTSSLSKPRRESIRTSK